MKSKTLISIILVTFASIFISCNDLLEETEFTYALASSTFYNSPDEANAAVLAPLDIMRTAYDANWFATLEINTEYVYPKGVYTGYNVNGIVNTTHETRLTNNW